MLERNDVRADEDAQRAIPPDLLGAFRRNLHARNSAANQGHVLVCNAHFARPERQVVDFSLEGINAGLIGNVALWLRSRCRG